MGVLLLLALLPLTGGCGDAGPAPVPRGLRVMVVGDSISQGLPGDATWRYWFVKAFEKQHVPVTMVGPTRGEKDDIESYELPWTNTANTAHAALGGSTLDDHLPLVEGEVSTYHPSVVVIELGLNDRKQRDSPPEVAAQTKELADRIWEADPHVRIVWTQILGQADVHRRPRVQHDRTTERANRLIESTLGTDPRVTIATTSSWHGGSWRPGVDTTDGTHPNASGQTLLAQRIAAAFHTMGLLPARPHIAHHRTWAPDPVPQLSRDASGHLVVDWAKAAIDCWTTSFRIVIRDARGHVVRRGSRPAIPYAAPGRATYRLRPGRYTVTLTPTRHWMTGAPSDPVAIRLPRHGSPRA